MERYFMPIYTTVVGIIIGALVSWIRSLLTKSRQQKEKEENIADALKDGMAILLRRQLFDYYGTYEYQDSIPASEWDEIEETHTVYKKLGGNHTGDRIFNEMNAKHLQSKVN